MLQETLTFQRSLNPFKTTDYSETLVDVNLQAILPVNGTVDSHSSQKQTIIDSIKCKAASSFKTKQKWMNLKT